MSGTIDLLDQPRALNALGLPTSAVVYYYLTGTTTLANIYSDLALTTPKSNPVVISAGEMYPSVFLDPNITYRRRIVYGDGTIHDVDPLPDTGVGTIDASAVTFTQSGTGAVSETVQAVLRNFGKMVTSFGANPTDASDDTAAVQAAINTGSLNIMFPPGTYYLNNITMSTPGQRLVALGRVLIYKNANGPLLTCSGVSQGIQGIEFQGVSASFTGKNVVSSGNFFSFEAGSEDAQSYALECTGAAPVILPGPFRIWTADATATGFDIVISGPASANLYGRIIGHYSSQATGGILLQNTGAVQIIGGQFGKLSVKLGAGSAGSTGPMVLGPRIVGAVVIEQSGTHLDAKCAANVTVGDGTNAISGIIFPTTFTMQTPNVLTINNLVVESSFHLGQIYSGSVTVNINAGSLTTNDIFHGAIAYTPTFTSTGGSPAVGDGTIVGSYSRSGRSVTATVSFTIGASTNGGAGAMRFGLPMAIKGATGVVKNGSGFLSDVSAPLNYPCTTQGSPSNSYMTLAYAGTALVSNGGPFTVATGDLFQAQLTYDV